MKNNLENNIVYTVLNTGSSSIPSPKTNLTSSPSYTGTHTYTFPSNGSVEGISLEQEIKNIKITVKELKEVLSVLMEDLPFEKRVKIKKTLNKIKKKQ